MRTLLSGLLILAAAAALVTVGSERMAQAPAGKTVQSGDSPWESHRALRRDSPRFAPVLLGDVPEVVVTAERPAWLMPEVVVSANSMPEVVVYASWSPPAVAATSPQASFVN